MIINSSPSPDPQESCAHIMSAVRSTGLTWGTQETPYSLFLTIRKRFLKDAKTRLNLRNPTHTLGVDRGNLQCEQLAASNTEMQLKIQNLETGIERLRTDLESEVSSNEKLNIALNVSKSLVDNLNTKYAEAIEQVNKSAKTFVDHDTTKKALKKAKEEVSRLTNKTNESLKTIAKLRETTIPEVEYNKILQQNYHLKDQLLEADERATIAEDEIFTFKEQNAKLSKQVTKLMIALNNSNSSQDALEKQISDNAALNNNPVLAAKGANPRQLTRKELKKLRQKTKKILAKVQDNENNEAHEDENSNEPVDTPMDPNQNSPKINGSDDDGDTASDADIHFCNSSGIWARPAREAPPESSSGDNSDNDNDRLEALLNPWKVPSAEGNEDVIKAINFFNTIPCPPDPLFPDGMVNNAGVWVRPAGWVPPESSSADSSAAKPGDGSEENISLPPSTQTQCHLNAEGMTGVLSEGSGAVNNVEKETLIELLVRTVHYHLRDLLAKCLVYGGPLAYMGERVTKDLKQSLGRWHLRGTQLIKCSKCRHKEEDHMNCLPCLVIKNRAHHGPDDDLGEERCAISTNVMKLLKELNDDQIGNICKLFAKVCSESVCTNYKFGSGRLDTITPPWGEMGLGYSLRDFSFNKENYLTHHAAGTLADQLVRRGLFEAATIGEEDQRTQGEADQQTKSVDTKAK